tara:strand:- start:14898 stop:15113 length:216 start_codon:yes stop_codon:yes gene_type:complete
MMEKFTVFSAVEFAENHAMKLGAGDVEEADKYVAAFQFLINSGVVWELQGSLGRQAAELIDAGFCTIPDDD